MKPSKSKPNSIHRAKGASIIRVPLVTVFVFVAVLVSTTGFVPGVTQSVAAESQLPVSVAPSGRDRIAPASRGIPLTFIENVGQFDERVHFQARSGNTTLFLTGDALWVSLIEPSPQSDPVAEAEMLDAVDAESETGRQVNLKLSFVSANPHPRLEPFNRLDTRISFFTGNDPSKWHTNAPTWGGVRYVDLYPGVDLEITSQNGQLAQRLVVREHSSLQNVRLRVEGADNLALEGNYLRLATLLGDIALPLLTVEGTAPKVAPAISVVDEAYQVSTPFASISSLAINATLTSTSTLLYSTYLGGSGEDRGQDIAVDNAGNVYVTGQTASVDFPTTPGVHDTSNNDDTPSGQISDCTGDAFITKLSADGSALLYSTYLGGGRSDSGMGIVVDDAGNVYITGATYSTDFPTTDNAWDRNLSGGRDAYMAKLNADGSDLVYSTYLGGNSWDYGFCIAIDDTGNAYVGGFTHGSFPVTDGAAQTTFGGSGDGFATKLSPDGSTLSYSTYLGGYSWESIDGIAIDNAGNAYLASHTHSTDFPTTPGAWDRVCDNCQTNVSTDGAVAKLNADGSEFIYSTLIGGADASGGEAFKDIAIDSAGNAYLTGSTSSTDFPTTTHALQPGFGGGGDDAVVVKLNADGSDLLYSTYLGGGDVDRGYGIAIDGDGNAYVTGYTASTDFATVDPLQASNAGGHDAFVAQVNDDGSALLYSTYLGGSGNDDQSRDIAINNSTGDVYLTGSTGSTDFPTTTGAFDTNYSGGNHDAFVTNLDLSAPIALGISPPGTISNGGLTYVPVKLDNVDSADDVRGVQFSLRVTDTAIISPAAHIAPTMGGLFPSTSITLVTVISNGWKFLLTAPLSPTAAVSGTGTIVNLPFVANSPGCVTLTFSDHKLSNSNAQPIFHTVSDATMCVGDMGSIRGSVYLDWRNSGHYTDTQIVLVGPREIYTATTDASGNYTFAAYADTYTLRASHTLFVQAQRAITVAAKVTMTVPQVGLWAGDIDQDQNVTLYDWYLLAAAIKPVEDPAFDIDANGETDIYDLIRLENNRGQPDMTTTNPPIRPGLLTRSIKRNQAAGDIGELELASHGSNAMLLRLVGGNEPVCAVGTRITLPATITVDQVVRSAAVAGGFLEWHQDGDNLYIVIAPPVGKKIDQDSDVLVIHGTSEATIAAENVVPIREEMVFLPLILKQ